MPPRDFGPKSPVTIAPPAGSTENVSPKVRVPSSDEGAKTKSTAETKSGEKGSSKSLSGSAALGAGAKTSAAGKNAVGGKIPDVDELAARFAALKK